MCGTRGKVRRLSEERVEQLEATVLRVMPFYQLNLCWHFKTRKYNIPNNVGSLLKGDVLFSSTRNYLVK
jgi:hypothetical protein